MHEGQLVRGHQQRRAAGRDFVEQLEQGVLAGLIEPDEGLVDQHHLEGAHHRDGDGRLLPQATAERGGNVVAAVAEVQTGEQRLGRVGPVGHAVQPGDVLEVLPQRQVVVEGGRIAEPAQRSAGRLRTGEVAGDACLATAVVEQAGRHPQQGGLATAVVADQCHVLPLGHFQVEREQRRPVAVVLAQLMRAEGGAHAWLLCCRWALVWLRPSSMNWRILTRTRSRTFTQ